MHSPGCIAVCTEKLHLQNAALQPYLQKVELPQDCEAEDVFCFVAPRMGGARVLVKLANEVFEALTRIGMGTYGMCVECRQEIDEERLMVLPEVKRCYNCQLKVETRRKKNRSLF